MRRVAFIMSLLLLSSVPVLPAAHGQEQPPLDPDTPRVEAGVAPDAPIPEERPGEAFASPEVAALQRTAQEVQQELDDLSGQIDTARQRVDEAQAELRSARAEREDAELLVEQRQDEVDEFSRSVFTAMGRADEFRLLITAANGPDLLEGTSMLGMIRKEQDERLFGALERRRRAVAAERAAQDAQQEAAQREAELEQRRIDATNRADAVSAELRGPIDEANAAVIAQQRAQKKRNAEAAENWQDYLDRLDEAGITSPPAQALRDPEQLPAGLQPYLGDDDTPQAGVAQTTVDEQRLLVLPQEVIDAVSAAIDALGKPYVPGEGTGPEAYSCDGLTHSVFTDAGIELPTAADDQLATGVSVPSAEAHPGDLIFVGPAEYGVQSVGIVLGDRHMLVADGRLASVVVTDRPAGDSVLGVVRPSLGTRSATSVPQRAEGELTWRCGGIELSQRPSGSAAGAAGAWGGYPNGLIPAAALCPIGVSSHVLRCDAAQAYRTLSQAYAAEFGEPLCITDSYRTFDGQVDLYRRKPSLAAVPGTSQHGWALAVDLCGGVQSFGTPQHDWLAAHASAFGWVNPDWAQPGQGREEPWHWEFTG